MRTTTTLVALGVLSALPAAALADPPAVGAPTIPAVFTGAPTNDNPNAGEFTVNFDSDGYRGIGSAPEPPLTRDMTPSTKRVFRQARANAPSAGESRSVDGLFANLRRELRDDAGPQAALTASAR
ncbi:MAG: hypothetical protein IAI49_01300 [Candidatus Eremiobacteraeota bacterium]|nr:hypothetical protein [Candidatus Eremiobacteraeota bacterium]